MEPRPISAYNVPCGRRMYLWLRCGRCNAQLLVSEVAFWDQMGDVAQFNAAPLRVCWATLS